LAVAGHEVAVAGLVAAEVVGVVAEAVGDAESVFPVTTASSQRTGPDVARDAT